MRFFLLAAALGAFVYAQTTQGPVSYTDRRCGEDLSNLWLDVVAVVDNSIGMTNNGLSDIAANIASVFSDNTRIGNQAGEPRTTRVGLVTYNSQANINADLNAFKSIDDLYDGVFNYLGHVSNSDESYLANGLAAAEDIFEAGSQTNRSHYQRVVVVYASTYKGTGALNPVPVAERLKTAGTIIVTVAYDQSGDGALLADLAKIATPNDNFSNTDNAGNTIGEIQGALLQANCFCPNGWQQYRASFADVNSYRYGVCIQGIGLNSNWRAAKLSCRNHWANAFLASEYDQNKHDYVFAVMQNTTGATQPFTYHIGLSLQGGSWVWERPAGETPVPLQNWEGWNPTYPIQSSSLNAVSNLQASQNIQTGWTNIDSMKTPANYACEVASCDTDNYCASVDSSARVIKN